MDSTPTRPASAMARLMTANVALRLAGVLSGQLFAFAAASSLVGDAHAQTRWGAIVVGLVGAAFNAATLLAVPWAGRIGDVRGHHRVLAYAPLIGAVASALGVVVTLAGAHGPVPVALLLVARVLEGVGASCAIPSMFTILSRATEHDPAARTRAMGAFDLTGASGLIVGLLCAGLLWQRFGVHALLVIVPLYLVAVPPLLQRRGGLRLPASSVVPRAFEGPGARTTVPPLGSTLRALAARREHRAFAVLWMAINAVVGLWLQYLPYVLILGRPNATQRLVGSVTGSGASGLFATVGALFAGGTVLFAFVGARWSRRFSLAVALSGIVGSAVVLTAINHGAPRALYVLAAGCVVALGGATPAALAHLGDLTADEDQARGTAMGAYSFLLGVGQFAGTLVGGPFVSRWQLDGVAMVSFVLGLIALASLVWMTPRTSVHRHSLPAPV